MIKNARPKANNLDDIYARKRHYQSLTVEDVNRSSFYDYLDLMTLNRLKPSNSDMLFCRNQLKFLNIVFFSFGQTVQLERPYINYDLRSTEASLQFY